MTAEIETQGRQKMMDVRYINPFVEATIFVLKTMCRIEAVRKDLKLKQVNCSYGDASAVIGLMGEGLEGSVAISFGEELMSEIVAMMVGSSPDDLTLEEMYDGLGELVNMIAGNAKSALSSSEGMSLSLSLPTLISGPGHEIAHRSDTPCFVVTFETKGRSFALQVALKLGS